MWQMSTSNIVFSTKSILRFISSITTWSHEFSNLQFIFFPNWNDDKEWRKHPTNEFHIKEARMEQSSICERTFAEYITWEIATSINWKRRLWSMYHSHTHTCAKAVSVSEVCLCARVLSARCFFHHRANLSRIHCRKFFAKLFYQVWN